MMIIIPLIGDAPRLPRGQPKQRRSSRTRQTQERKQHRYELVHDNDADFIAYQRHLGEGVWQTFSTWMIPRTNED